MNADSYSIIEALIEKNLLVVQRQELVEWLERLQSKGEIQEEEIDNLMPLADQLQIYDEPRSEFFSIEELPFVEWLQEHESRLFKF